MEHGFQYLYILRLSVCHADSRNQQIYLLKRDQYSDLITSFPLDVTFLPCITTVSRMHVIEFHVLVSLLGLQRHTDVIWDF